MESDMDAELRFHIEAYAEDLVRRGAEPGEARRLARLALGGIDRAKEECRDVRGLNLFDSFIKDVRYGARMLGKNPGFSAIVVLTLALGIGANTAIFSLTNTVLLKPLPIGHPEQLVQIDLPDPEQAGASYGFSYPVYSYLRDHNDALSGVFALASLGRLNIAVGGEAEPAEGQIVSADYYSTLGITAAAGRTLAPDDDRTGEHLAAVISYGYWKRRFGLDLGVVGRDITINGNPFTIVGVTQPEFFGVTVGDSPDLTVPMIAQPLVMSGRPQPGDSGTWWLTVMGRLRPGVSEEQARVNLDVAFHQVAPRQMGRLKVAIIPSGKGLSQFRDRFSKPLLALMVLVSLVLVIACANVAGLLLSRAASRRREIALRSALGARRKRLIRQLLIESSLLAGLGGGVGLAIAVWLNNVLVSLASSGGVPITIDLHFDSSVLEFAVSISVLTGILFGLAPALRLTRVDLTPELKTASRRSGSPGSRLIFGKGLVISQVALGLLLIVGTGLFVRTLRNLKAQDLGFNKDNLVTFAIDPTLCGYQNRMGELYIQVLERIGKIPGIRAVSASHYGEMTLGRWEPRITVPGYAPAPNELNEVQANLVGPRFFETTGMALLEGRDFTGEDAASSAKVIVVNEATARHYFGSADCLGRRLSVSGIGGEMQIAGVVKNAKYHSPREATLPMIFIPFLQLPEKSPSFLLSPMTFEARTALSPESVTPLIRQELQMVDKSIAIFAIKTLSQQVDESLVRERLLATLSSVLGLLALALGCLGLYGVMAYNVAQRTNEIGIRMALGAPRRRVLWMVLSETLVLVSAGIGIGLPIALVSTRLVSSLLFGLSPTDPPTVAASILLMLTAAVTAGYVPALKASRVDPVVALRYE
jgi:predicted permease